MKRRKSQKKLNARINAWDELKAIGMRSTTTKMVAHDGKQFAHHKPGSQH